MNREGEMAQPEASIIHFSHPHPLDSQPATSTSASLLLRVQAQGSGMDIRLRALQLLPPRFMLQNAPSSQLPRRPTQPHPHPPSNPSLPTRCLQMLCLRQARQRLLLPLHFMQPPSPHHLCIHAVDSNSPLPPSRGALHLLESHSYQPSHQWSWEANGYGKKWAGQRSDNQALQGSLVEEVEDRTLVRHSSKDYWVVAVVMQVVEVEEEMTLVVEWATGEAMVGLVMEASSQWVNDTFGGTGASFGYGL